MKLNGHKIADVTVNGMMLGMQVDGVPLQVNLQELSYRLATCTDAQRKQVEVIVDGAGLYWPDVDEMLVVEALLAGEDWRREQPERWEEAMANLF